mgnify:FL=1
MKVNYWDEAIDYLVSKDKKLKNIINSAGNVFLETSEDPFMTLFNSILGQQISVAAAKSIKNKISTNFDINPVSLSNLSLIHI